MYYFGIYSERFVTPWQLALNFSIMTNEKLVHEAIHGRPITLPNNVIDMVGFHEAELSRDVWNLTGILLGSKNFQDIPRDIQVDLLSSLSDLHHIWLLIRDQIKETD